MWPFDFPSLSMRLQVPGLGISFWFPDAISSIPIILEYSLLCCCDRPAYDGIFFQLLHVLGFSGEFVGFFLYVGCFFVCLLEGKRGSIAALNCFYHRASICKSLRKSDVRSEHRVYTGTGLKHRKLYRYFAKIHRCMNFSAVYCGKAFHPQTAIQTCF